MEAIPRLDWLSSSCTRCLLGCLHVLFWVRTTVMMVERLARPLIWMLLLATFSRIVAGYHCTQECIGQVPVAIASMYVDSRVPASRLFVCQR